MKFSRCLLVAVACLLLGACASLPPSAAPLLVEGGADSFMLEGRFSLRHEDKNVSGRLSWRHAGAANEVLLSSPFGQGVAEIRTDAAGARLNTAEGKSFSAPDAETLTREVLGYPLPLGLLTDWVRGRAGNMTVTGSAAGVERDVLGRVQRLRHEDWTIDYAYDSDDAQALPGRIVAAQAGGIELRLKIDQWQGESRP